METTVWYESLNAVDWVVLVLLGIGLLQGLRRGPAHEAAILLGLAVAGIGARYGHRALGQSLSEWITLEPPAADLTAFLLVAGGIYAVTRLLWRVAQMIADSPPPRPAGRLVGAAAGMLRMGVFCAIVLWLLGLLPDERVHRHAVEESRCGQLVHSLTGTLRESPPEKTDQHP